MINKGEAILFAGLGNPSYPTNLSICETAIQEAEHLIQTNKILKNLDKVNKKELASYFKNPSHSNSNETLIFLENKIKEDIKQGEAQGCKEARTIMAQGLNQFYGWNNSTFKINASHILFNIGGVAGLHNIVN
ncbi:MAG: hypothetical protein JWM09_1315 [Francisellaceae bacterium]|nr:hypothetical protein [Francisellaceae bacterium]